jgi:chromosome segregation ATPase
MTDQRLAELLEHLDETGPDGNSTVLAQFAAKVSGYQNEIEALRAELTEASNSITAMETRTAGMEAQLKDRESLRADLVYEAQDAAVRAAMSGSTGGAAGMLRHVEECRQKLNDFDAHFKGDQVRLDRHKISVDTKRAIIRQNRDLIALRLNTVSSLLDRVAAQRPVHADPPVPAGGAARKRARPAVTGQPVTPAVNTGALRTGVRPRLVRRIRVIRRR